jgi:Rrf2 family nitric oxide-sensitive transcriptional repressor
MRLTNFSDYTLRLLMYAAAQQGRRITIEETSKIYGISRAHLMKIANMLTQAGYLKAVRGRSGGLELAKHPEKIGLGDLLRLTEPDFALVECFATGEQCIITSRCRLRGALKEALHAFLATLDRYTLADLMLRPRDFGLKPAA